jgi:hypothetical protein
MGSPAEQPLTVENLAQWVNSDWKWMPRKGSWFQKLSYRLAKELLDTKLKLQMYEGQARIEKTKSFADEVKKRKR